MHLGDSLYDSARAVFLDGRDRDSMLGCCLCCAGKTTSGLKRKLTSSNESKGDDHEYLTNARTGSGLPQSRISRLWWERKDLHRDAAGDRGQKQVRPQGSNCALRLG